MMFLEHAWQKLSLRRSWLVLFFLAQDGQPAQAHYFNTFALQSPEIVNLCTQGLFLLLASLLMHVALTELWASIFLRKRRLPKLTYS